MSRRRLHIAATAFCNNMFSRDLPQSDYTACGLGELELWGYNSNLYMEKKCTNPACKRIYAFLDSTNPNECLIDRAQPVSFRTTVLNPLYKKCSELLVQTIPPTPTPTPTPAPTPDQTPAPAPTTKTPTKTPVPSLSSNAPPTTEPPESETPPPSSKAPRPTNSTSLPPSTTPAPDITEDSTPAPSINTIVSSAPPSARTTSRAPSTSAPDLTDVTVSTSHSSTSSTPWIVGAIAALGLITVVLIVFYRRRKRDQSAKAIHTPATGTGTDTSMVEYLNGDTNNYLPLESRNQMDAMLNDDHALTAWRLFSQHTTDKKFLGKGSHAFVHLVELSNGTLLAAKRLARDQATPKHLAQLLSEVHIVATLSHPSIVQFKGVTWTTAIDFQVLFEYMRGGDLRSYLDEQPRPSSSQSAWTRQKLEIARSIAAGLVYAHSFNAPLVHRDLKSRNILLTEDLQAKISDFGVSRFQSENGTMTTGVGTNRWLAPEVLSSGGAYNEKCDIYSFGVVMTELDTHELPLEREIESLRSSQAGDGNQSDFWVLQQFAKGTLRPSMSSSSPPEVRDLVMRCLSFNPSDRPDALELSFRLRKLVSSTHKSA